MKSIIAIIRQKNSLLALMVFLGFLGALFLITGVLEQGVSSAGVFIGLLIWMFAINLMLFLNVRKHFDSLHKTNRAILSAISISQLNLQEPTTFLNHAAYPDFIELVLELVRRYKPQNILELGSGSSTKYLTAYLKAQSSSARLISLEDSLGWTRLIQEEVERLNNRPDSPGNSDVTKNAVLHAPLISVGGYNQYNYKNYNIELDVPFDLVVVDGPHNVRDRIQIFSEIEKLMADDVIVIFDDGAVDELRKAVKRWSQAGWYTRYYDTYKGTWIMWRNASLEIPLP
jgi:ABC-type antimicrobial peptide transport system permease subunit